MAEPQGFRIRDKDGGVTFDVLVAPRSSSDRLGPVVGDRLKVAITAPPVDGRANAAIVELLARVLCVPRRAVTVVAGARGKRKTVRVEGLDGGTARSLLEAGT